MKGSRKKGILAGLVTVVLIGLVLVLVPILVLDSGSAEETSEVSTNITIVDSLGREVEIPYPLERIALLAGTVGEVIRCLGETDRIVGITQDMADKTEYWADLKDITVCGSTSQPNYEVITELDPDVVIVFGPWNWKPEVAENLEAAGLKVVALECFKPKTLAQDVMIVGEMLGREEEAEEFVDFFLSYIDVVAERVADLQTDERKQVYHEWGSDYSSSGPGSSWDEAIVMAGGINIFADAVVSYPKVSPEAILERDPQVVIKTLSTGQGGGYSATDADELIEVRDTLLSRSGWEDMDAGENGGIYVVSTELGYGAMRVVSICYLAKCFYPELFTDLDPQEMLKEYLERYQGLKDQGVYIYPEP